MDDNEKFTNRHGHTITALQEAVNTLPEPEYKTAVPKSARRKKRFIIHLTGVQWRILGIVVLVLLLTPVFVGEYVRATYSKNIDDAKGDISQVFAAAQSQPKTATTSKSLAELENQLSSIRDRLCPGGFLDNLAKLYPRAQAAYSDCAAYRSNVTALVDLVGTASSQMVYLESLQPLLEGVSKPLEDQFAILSAQQENWQTFVDGIQKLSVPLSLSAAHTSLLKEATNVRDEWIALVQASNVEDSVAFRAAKAKLTDSFSAFHAVATTYSAAVKDSQAVLNNAVATFK